MRLGTYPKLGLELTFGPIPFHIRRKRWGIPHTPIYPALFGCWLPCLDSSRRSIEFVDCKSRKRSSVEVSVDQYDLEHPRSNPYSSCFMYTLRAQTDKYVQTFQKGNCYSIFDRDGTKSQKNWKHKEIRLSIWRPSTLLTDKLPRHCRVDITTTYVEESPLIQ